MGSHFSVTTCHSDRAKPVLYISLILYYYSLGLVLVTDAIIALGLPPGVHRFGPQTIEMNDEKATIAGTNILAGRSVYENEFQS
jgi:N-acetylglucosamine-6-phosphate deacetylase